MLGKVVGTMVLGFIARKVDKKWAAVTLCTVTACASYRSISYRKNNMPSRLR